jgi:hypothetical protein
MPVLPPRKTTSLTSFIFLALFPIALSVAHGQIERFGTTCTMLRKDKDFVGENDWNGGRTEDRGHKSEALTADF